MIRQFCFRKSAMAVAFGYAFLFVPAYAPAQTAQAQPGPIDRAQVLQENAQQLYPQPDRWQDAAAMLTQAARLRPAGDPEKQRMLATAAHLYAYRGNDRFAIYWLERGAEQALAGGDVVTAASAYTEAAFIAGEHGDWKKVKKMATRVETLLASPLLTDDQRESIRRPFDQRTLASVGGAR